MKEIIKISKKNKIDKKKTIISSVIAIFFAVLLIYGTININRKKQNEELEAKNKLLKREENSISVKEIETVKEPDKPIEKEVKKRRITEDLINFRKDPSVDNNNLISTIAKNEIVDLIEENLGTDKKWAKVKYKDKEGYVVMEYLSEDLTIPVEENRNDVEENNNNENNTNNYNDSNSNNNNNSENNYNTNPVENNPENNSEDKPEENPSTNEPENPDNNGNNGEDNSGNNPDENTTPAEPNEPENP